MEERRKETRKKIMKFALVYGAGGKMLGYLDNLTMQGVMLIGEKRMEVGQVMPLAIELPDDLPGLPKRMSITGRVARCVPHESPTSCAVGIEFTEVSPENERIIRAVLERYHFKHQIDMST